MYVYMYNIISNYILLILQIQDKSYNQDLQIIEYMLI